MAKRTRITPEELVRAKHQRDQAATIPAYRKALAVLLVAECGFSAEQVAEVLGMSRRTDAQQVRLLGLADADDRAIWQYAKTNGFTLVSQDVDFADMAALFGPPPKVVWLRCGNQSSAIVEKIIRRHQDAMQALETDETAEYLQLY